jgi:GDP-L-fucose synthase
MDLDARILVTGQCGWVGNAVVRRLWAAGYSSIRFLAPGEVDLARAASVEALLFRERPEYVWLTAAREGADGSRSGEAVRESLAVQANVIHAAWRTDVRKLCFLASSGVYPTGPLPPLRDGALLSAAVEPGQDGEALARIAGIRMCQVYRRQYRFDAISAVPAGLYGPGDTPGAQAGVLPALVRRLYEAQAAGAPELAIGAVPARDWLQVDDFADAALFLMRHYSSEVPVNVGGGETMGFVDLVRMVAETVGYRGRLLFGRTATPERAMPDGAWLNTMGWAPYMPLRDGVEQMCAWYLQGVGAVMA